MLHLGAGYKPSGREEKIESPGMTNFGAAWLPNGREFVFTSGTGTNFGLWRLAISKGAVPRRLDLGIAAANRRSSSPLPLEGCRVIQDLERRSDSWLTACHHLQRIPAAPFPSSQAGSRQ